MASENRNQDKVKIREGEWNNYSCFLFLISIAQNPSLSGALWLILVFSVCMGQFVERDQGQFLLSPGIRIPWVGTLGSEAGYRVTEPCQVSLDRKPLSAGPGDSFLWVIKCDVSRVFLFCDVFFSYWWHNTQTVWQTQRDQQICVLPFSINMPCVKVCKEISWWRLMNYCTCFIMLTVPWTRKCLMN